MAGKGSFALGDSASLPSDPLEKVHAEQLDVAPTSTAKYMRGRARMIRESDRRSGWNRCDA